MISSFVLICGVVASLALGVLVAHGLCVGMFALLEVHSRQIAVDRNLQPAQLKPTSD